MSNVESQELLLRAVIPTSHTHTQRADILGKSLCFDCIVHKRDKLN